MRDEILYIIFKFCMCVLVCVFFWSTV